MSNQSSAIRSPRSSGRYSPYSRSLSSSPLLSDQRPSHSPDYVNTARNSSAVFLSPESAHYPSTHPGRNHMTGCTPVPPSAVSQTVLIPPPTYFPDDSFPQGSNHHCTCSDINYPYPDPTTSHLIHPPPSSQPRHAAQLGDSIDGDSSTEQQTLQLPQRRTITSHRPKQDSSYRNQGTFNQSHTFPTSTEQHSTSTHSHFSETDTGRTDTPTRHAESQLPPASTSHHQSTSDASVHPAPDFKPVRASSSYNFQASAHQNHSSMHLVPPSLSLLPQEQILTVHAPSHPSRSQGAFSHAHHFVVKDSVFIDNNTTSDNFMEKLLQHTIIGAEFDSSAREPPPRCHPGTRLVILQRCLDFIVECSDEGKLRWVVGPAGVGKSAIMQIVTEKAPDIVMSASVFFSVNGRQDGTKTIMTIAYQLAVKCELYHQYIRNEITRDPSLLQKPLSVHFKRFIVEPFIRKRLFDPSDRFLIVIDGLDECDDPLTQLNVLELISDFCVTHTTSPIAWIVASRPEPHITSFFERVEVQPAYIKEEIQIDSDEACEDVQRYLRDELRKIQVAYPSLRRKREWPSEFEFTKIASAAGGLFAYASALSRYISHPRYQNPTAQLRHILETIDAAPLDNTSGRIHPMAQLDALYARILSNIPDDVMKDTRKLLLLHSGPSSPVMSFRLQCNLLGLTEDAAYNAISHLHAVAKIPEPDRVDRELFQYLHKSFEDFLFDFKRSGFSQNVRDEAEELTAQAFFRIVQEVPNDSDSLTERVEFGIAGALRGGPGLCDNVSLSWPSDGRFTKSDDYIRLKLYCASMDDTCFRFRSDHNFYGNMTCFHVLTTRFSTLSSGFPADQLREAAFGKFRHELTELGELKQVPLRTLDLAAVCGDIELRFMSPIGTDVELSDPWNPSCSHDKFELGDTQQRSGWRTQFGRFVENGAAATDIFRFSIVARRECHQDAFGRGWGLFNDSIDCSYCSQRFARHIINNQDRLASVFVDSTGLCYVEFMFIDVDDGVSEWRYRFFHSGPPITIDV